jgi:hypothetical protein
MSTMAHYREDIKNGLEELCMDRVRDFEEATTPTFAPLSLTLNDSADLEAVHAYSLIRSFQHAALIYLYRAICGFPATHVLVQQHVLPCLDCIFSIEQASNVRNCVIFPLLVAGAHVQSIPQRRGVINAISSIHSGMRFASVQYARSLLENIWRLDSVEMPWDDLFSGLGLDVAIL